MSNWFGRLGGNRGQGFRNESCCPETIQYERPQVSPTRQFVQNNMTTTVVPHYHPSHLTTVNHHHIEHQHHFPHTQSVVNKCHETHTMCGKPFTPQNNCGCNTGCHRCRKW